MMWFLVDRNILKMAQDGSLSLNLNFSQWILKPQGNATLATVNLAKEDADDIRAWIRKCSGSSPGFILCKSDQERQEFRVK